MREQPPWKTELVEGHPIQVGQRQLIPVVKVRSTTQRQVTFGTGASRSSGGGLVWLQPAAIIERRPDGSEERIPIPDETWMAIKGMLIGALALPILYLVIATWAFWARRRPAKKQTA